MARGFITHSLAEHRVTTIVAYTLAHENASTKVLMSRMGHPTYAESRIVHFGQKMPIFVWQTSHKWLKYYFMNDKSFTNWRAMSDKAISAQIGRFVRHHRLEQNRTQETLSHDAGISRSTLSLLERGETVTLATLIQVLRVLDLLHVMDAFDITPTISPLALAKAERSRRKRARHSR